MQKKQLCYTLLLSISIFILASGFLKQVDKKHELEGPILSEKTYEQSGVTLKITKLNANNTQLFTKKSLHRFYQPIEISITNNTADNYNLSKNNININLESTRNVARKLKKNLILAFFWPLAYINPLKAHLELAAYTGAATMPALFPIWLGIKIFSDIGMTSYDNKRTKKHFRNYATDLIDGLDIPPHKTVKKFAYIKKEFYRPNFDIRLVNTRSGAILNYSVRMR